MYGQRFEKQEMVRSHHSEIGPSVFEPTHPHLSQQDKQLDVSRPCQCLNAIVLRHIHAHRILASQHLSGQMAVLSQNRAPVSIDVT